MTSEIDGESFSTENRGLRYTFPLSALSRVYEERDYVYLDFTALGRARLPFSAFGSVSDRLQFARTLQEKTSPNQPPSRMPVSGTPAVGAPVAPPPGRAGQ